MFFEPKKLSEQEIQQKEIEFQNLSVDLHQANLVREQMKEYFFSASANDIKEFKFTYWRWYVELVWKYFNSIPKNELVDIFQKQVPMAIINSYNVVDILLGYFGMRILDEPEAKSFFVSIKNAFLTSNVAVGNWQSKEVTISELAKEIANIEQKGSSLDRAEFETKLKQIMFPNDPIAQKYTLVDPNVGVERFIDLVVFFQNISENQIWEVVNNFLYADVKESVEKKPAPEPVVEVAETPVAVKEISLAEVKKIIDAQFIKDVNGQYENIEGVFAKLSELADEYTDESVGEMLYWDETSGMFVWKTE